MRQSRLTQGGVCKAGGIILASRTILGRQPGWARMGARAGHAAVLLPRLTPILTLSWPLSSSCPTWMSS